MTDIYGFHIVLTTHNSRTSHRMVTHGIVKGDPLILNLTQEIVLTKSIGDIIQENNYKCVAFNICQDHVHLLIICAKNELTGIIQKLKAISSKRFNRSNARSNESMKYHNNRLWSQKFFKGHMDDWQLARLSNIAGEVYQSDHLLNSINYIQNNRQKHQLIENEELNNLISSFTISIEKAYELL